LSEAPAAAASAVPAKVGRYAERLLRRYDKNKDGNLQADEWRNMHGHPEAADGNHDGAITLEELTSFIAVFGQNRRLGPENPIAGQDSASQSSSLESGAQESKPQRASPDGAAGENRGTSVEAAGSQPAAGAQPLQAATFHVPRSRLPAGLPDWFLRRDLNGDGQLSLSEYAPIATPAELEEFARFDPNGDGFITARECLDTLKPPARGGVSSPDKSGKKSSGK
jgi:hypothetical protein